MFSGNLSGMVNQQAYGVSMQGGVNVGMQPQNPQQVAQQLLQQQQLQLQQQQQQMQQQQQQQQSQQQPSPQVRFITLHNGTHTARCSKTV